MKRINDKGVTLVELIVVIAILTVLLGSATIGIGLIASGNAEKASKNIRSIVSEVRTNTLTVQADWEAVIYNEDDTYFISIYRDGAEYDTTELGSRIRITYGDGDTELTEGNRLVISFRKSSGAVKSIQEGSTGGTLSPVETSGDSSGFIIRVSRSTTDYELKLWKDTGKITTEE